MRTNDNQPGGLDRVGHSSVQPWSAGEFFPAVIVQVETYAPPIRLEYLEQCYLEHFCDLPARGRLLATRHKLMYPGREPEFFSSHQEAEERARQLNALAPLNRILQQKRREAEAGRRAQVALMHPEDAARSVC